MFFGQRIETTCPNCGDSHSSMLEWLRKLPYCCPKCKSYFRLGVPETVRREGEKFERANFLPTEPPPHLPQEVKAELPAALQKIVLRAKGKRSKPKSDPLNGLLKK